MTPLEQQLRETRVAWPPTPDLAARLDLAPAPGRRRAPRWLIAVAVVLGVVAIPPARAAVLDLFGLRSVKVEHRKPTATPRPSGLRFGEGLGLGRRATLAAVGRRPPTALGRPDAVFVTNGRVSFLYRAGRAGLRRSSATGAGLLVTVMRSQITPFIDKLAAPGTKVRRLRLHGDPAFFLSGAQHGFAYATPGGAAYEEQRLAGNTLLVERSDGTLVRVEGRLSLRRAVRIAGTVP